MTFTNFLWVLIEVESGFPLSELKINQIHSENPWETHYSSKCLINENHLLIQISRINYIFRNFLQIECNHDLNETQIGKQVYF